MKLFCFYSIIEECRDLERFDCPYWFEMGYCEDSRYEAYLTKNCRKTCNACGKLCLLKFVNDFLKSLILKEKHI